MRSLFATIFEKLRNFTRYKSSKVDTNVEKPKSISIESLFIEIGKTLVLCQTVEHHIEGSLRTAFADTTSTEAYLALLARSFNDDSLDFVGELEKLKPKEYKGGKPLGRMINDLREKVAIPSEFNALLETFKKHRNIFTHNLFYIEPFGVFNLCNLKDPEHRDIVYKFLQMTYVEARVIADVFYRHIQDHAAKVRKEQGYK